MSVNDKAYIWARGDGGHGWGGDTRRSGELDAGVLWAGITTAGVEEHGPQSVRTLHRGTDCRSHSRDTLELIARQSVDKQLI